MKALAYYDGKIGTPEELTVPFYDRAHFFGDGCYDAAMAANGTIFLLEDHLDRFYASARLLDIHIPMENSCSAGVYSAASSALSGMFVSSMATKLFAKCSSIEGTSESASRSATASITPKIKAKNTCCRLPCIIPNSIADISTAVLGEYRSKERITIPRKKNSSQNAGSSP